MRNLWPRLRWRRWGCGGRLRPRRRLGLFQTHHWRGRPKDGLRFDGGLDGRRGNRRCYGRWDSGRWRWRERCCRLLGFRRPLRRRGRGSKVCWCSCMRLLERGKLRPQRVLIALQGSDCIAQLLRCIFADPPHREDSNSQNNDKQIVHAVIGGNYTRFQSMASEDLSALSASAIRPLGQARWSGLRVRCQTARPRANAPSPYAHQAACPA